MICKVCNKQIEQERLNILPNTVFCAPCAQKHSKVAPRKGVMTFDNKTGGTLQIMSESSFQSNKHYYFPTHGTRVMKTISKSSDKF